MRILSAFVNRAHRLRHLVILQVVLIAGSNCKDHSEHANAAARAEEGSTTPVHRSTPQARENFLMAFHAAQKKGDRERMDSLCRDNPSEAERAMLQVDKMVAYFDVMKDHPALAGTQIEDDVVSPGELRALAQDLKGSIGRTTHRAKAPGIGTFSPTSEAPEDNRLTIGESKEYLRCFAKVNLDSYNAFLREFTFAYFESDKAKIRRVVTSRSGVIAPLLKDYFEFLVAMAADTNLKSASFEWSGAVSWDVPKLFDVIAALAHYQSTFLQDGSTMTQQMLSGLGQVLSASKRAAERSEAAGRYFEAIDKYLQIVALAERFEIPKLRTEACTKLSRLYYKSGDATKAREFAEKAKKQMEADL